MGRLKRTQHSTNSKTLFRRTVLLFVLQWAMKPWMEQNYVCAMGLMKSFSDHQSHHSITVENVTLKLLYLHIISSHICMYTSFPVSKGISDCCRHLSGKASSRTISGTILAYCSLHSNKQQRNECFLIGAKVNKTLLLLSSSCPLKARQLNNYQKQGLRENFLY